MRRLATLLLIGALLAGCASPAPPGDGDAPEWSFTDAEGDVHTRDAPPSNATVLFFMATWCGSCRAKAPVLAQAYDEHAARGVRFYSVGFDPSESPDALRAWQERYDQPWPHGLDEGFAMQRAFGVRIQSTVVLLDAHGRVAESWGYGDVTARALNEAIDATLAPRT